MKPLEVTGADMVFGGKAMEILPAWDDLPNEYKDNSTESCETASAMFFDGMKVQCLPKKGICGKLALDNIRCCLGSYTPSHEHKIGGIAWLIDQWFDEFTVEG